MPTTKPGDLVVIYKDQQLPIKPVLRLAHCLANNIAAETKLKFSSGLVTTILNGRNDPRLTLKSL